MNAGWRLSLYGLGVVAVFGLAAAVGAGLGPIDVGASSSHSAMSPGSSDATDSSLSGLTIAADGYRLVPDVGEVEADSSSTFTFHIERADGSVLSDFDTLHDREMHLIVLSRNLVDYLHLHPALDADGTWMVDLPALTPGSYRVYADFRPTGSDQITLATDVAVPGDVAPADVPAAADSTEVDGFTVALSGMTTVGENTLTFDVVRGGATIMTEPYLGAAGHLVVIRDGDLGYLHVHPLDGEAGPVRFDAVFPTPGMYRLFFEFSFDGTVRVASLTVEVARSGSSDAPETTDDHGSHSS